MGEPVMRRFIDNDGVVHQLRTRSSYKAICGANPYAADHLRFVNDEPTCPQCKVTTVARTASLDESTVPRPVVTPPYPWCPSYRRAYCAAKGYCDRNPNCGE